MPVNVDDLFVPTAIADVTAIDLTLAGQIELMQFHHEAIEFADKRMRGSAAKESPFPYFLKLCNIWHQDNNSPINHALVEEIQQKYGIKKSDSKINSNGRAPGFIAEKKTYQKGTPGEFVRKDIDRVYLNQQTDEEFEKIQKYHQRTRPHEYVTTFDNKLVRTLPKRTLEEELAFPLEERLQIIKKLEADWESPNGIAFRRVAGDSTVVNLFGRLVMQLQTGRVWPESPDTL